MPPIKDLTGQLFGRLYVVERGPDLVQPSGHHKTRYWCECTCKDHNRVLVLGSHLKDGHVKSCGCINKEMASERLLGKTGDDAIRRYNTNRGYGVIYQNYERIIAYSKEERRQVSICPEWYDPSQPYSNSTIQYKEFYNWSTINGADDDKILVRIDPNLPYSPTNCAWVYKYMARFVTRAGSMVNFNGANYPVVQVANALGCDYNQLYTTITRNNFAPLTVTCSDHGIARIYGNSFPQKRPVCAIYFEDKNGFLYNQEDYNDFQPTPCLWAVDGNGFVAGPILD